MIKVSPEFTYSLKICGISYNLQNEPWASLLESILKFFGSDPKNCKNGPFLVFDVVTLSLSSFGTAFIMIAHSSA